jgi:hypothetical protein
MRVPTTISPGPRSTDLEQLDQEVESHPIWTELRGPVTARSLPATTHLSNAEAPMGPDFQHATHDKSLT